MPAFSFRVAGLKFLRLFLAIVSGVVLTFAYPRWNVSALVWLALAPLFFALWWGEPARRPLRRGFGLGYLAGLAFFIPNLAWVRHSSRVIHGAMDNAWAGWGPELLGAGAVFGLSAYLALYWGLWGAFASGVSRPRLDFHQAVALGRGKWFSLSLESVRSAFLCAAAWVACEWLRGVVFTGFGWNGLGVALHGQPAMIQIAEWVGVTGLSFLPVFVSAVAYNTVCRFRIEIKTSRVRPHLDFFCAAVLVMLQFFYGVQVLSRARTQEPVPLKVLLIQQNVPQVVRWSGEHTEEIYQELGGLTGLGLAGNRADLVVWPESSLPYAFYDANHVPFLDSLFEERSGLTLITGADFYPPNGPAHTGAALLQGGFATHQIHYKVHLVPFGEYVPLRQVPFLGGLFSELLPYDFTPGATTEPFELKNAAGAQAIPLICFEDTVGRLARKFIRRAPQLMVNLTNDGWFLQSNQNEVHLANAMFRCVELRRPMARACNTGITCFVDAFGRVARGDKLVDPKTGSPFIKGALPKEVFLEKDPPLTFYARFGDVFSVSLLGVLIVAAGIKCLSLRRRKHSNR